MKRLFLSVFAFSLFLSLGFPAFGGNDPLVIGARRTAMGSAYTGITGDFWQLFSNPAGLGGLPGMQAGAAVERRFLMSSLNSGAFGFAMPFKERHAFGVYGATNGFDLYMESRIGLSYATTILEKVNIGARFNYLRTSIQSYGNAGAPVLDFGVITPISKSLSLGASVYNANLASLDKELNEDIPTVLSIGVVYLPSDKVTLVADFEKHINFDLDIRGGAEYRINKTLSARAGFTTNPVSVNMGAGLNFNQLQIDISNSHHADLGYSGQLSLSYNFGSLPSKKTEIESEE